MNSSAQQLSLFDFGFSISEEQVQAAAENHAACCVKPSIALRIRSLEAKAISVVSGTALAGHPLVVAWSGGRDSTATLNLALVAIKRLTEQGHQTTPLVVMHADTLVENPEMSAYAYAEMDAIRAFALKHNLPVTVEVCKPSLLSQWAVKTISGRNLPVFANKGSRDCTIGLKIQPASKLKKQILRNLGQSSTAAAVTVIGTRFAESTGRKKRMTERGETADGLWRDQEGLKLSPIADWTDEELWAYLAACKLA